MSFGLANVVGIARAIQAIYQALAVRPKIVGEVVEHYYTSSFEDALKGYDIRNFLVLAWASNLHSRETSIEWELELRCADGKSVCKVASPHTEEEWQGIAAELNFSTAYRPFDREAVLQRNIKHEGWVWFRFPMNLCDDPAAFSLRAREPSGRQHLIAEIPVESIP